MVVGVGEPWYIDLKAKSCGRIETGVPQRVTRLLLKAPAIPAPHASLVRQKLQPSAAACPLPEPLRKRERLEIKPVPILHLHCPRVVASRGLGWKREEEEVELPLARVSFDYAGAEIGWQHPGNEINHVKDNRLLVLPRDALLEVQAVERLNTLGLQPLGPTGLGRFAPESCRQDFTFEEDENDDVSMMWVQFNHAELPKLAREGWRISFAEDYPYRVARADEAWKLEVTESGIDWFELDLGIEVDGQKVPLLPVLLDLFNRAEEELTPASLAASGDEPIYGTLPDGRLLPIPASRLKAMLEALYELFASRRIDDSGTLKLARAEATRLIALEDALPPGALEWEGGIALRDMARRLAAVTEIPPVHGTQRSQGDAPPLPGGRPRLAPVPVQLWPLRCPRRRYGPGQDAPGPGPHPGREGGRASAPALPRRGTHQPDPHLAQRGPQVRPLAPRPGPARQRAPGSVREHSEARHRPDLLCPPPSRPRASPGPQLHAWRSSTRRRRSRTRPPSSPAPPRRSRPTIVWRLPARPWRITWASSGPSSIS